MAPIVRWPARRAPARRTGAWKRSASAKSVLPAHLLGENGSIVLRPTRAEGDQAVRERGHGRRKTACVAIDDMAPRRVDQLEHEIGRMGADLKLLRTVGQHARRMIGSR